MGRTRMPTAIRLLHGEERPSRINHREPKPGGQPRMPRSMDADSRVVWRRVIRDYGATGVLSAVDADVLRVYCDCLVRYEKASSILAKTGPIVAGARRHEMVKSPLHQVVRDEATLMRALARELGLTPSSRVGLTGRDRPPADPMDRFLDG